MRDQYNKYMVTGEGNSEGGREGDSEISIQVHGDRGGKL